MFILWSVRNVSPNSAAEKLCYDTIFPKLPIQEASHSESHKSGLPAGHQLFTTCSFTSSRRICIIYSSLRSLLGWTVPEHRDKIVFLWAFAEGMSGGENSSIVEAGNFSQKSKIQELDFLTESTWQHLENPVWLHAHSYSGSLVISLCTLHWPLCLPCCRLQVGLYASSRGSLSCWVAGCTRQCG